MLLDRQKKLDLFYKIARVLTELDRTDSIKKSERSVPFEERVDLCFYDKYNYTIKKWRELFFSGALNIISGVWDLIKETAEYRAADTSLEVINLAREIIRSGKKLLGVKDDNDDIINALRKLDELERVYNEMDKSLTNTQLISKLDAIIAAQETLQKNQDDLAKKLAELKSELGNKPDNLKVEVKRIADNVDALKARADKEDKQLEQKKHRRLFG